MPTKSLPDGTKPASASGTDERKQGSCSGARPSDSGSRSNVDSGTDSEYEYPSSVDGEADDNTRTMPDSLVGGDTPAHDVALNAMTPVVAKAVSSGSSADLKLPPRSAPRLTVLDAPTAVAAAVKATSWPARQSQRDEFEAAVREIGTWADVQARSGDWWPGRIVAVLDNVVEVRTPTIQWSGGGDTIQLPVSSQRLQPHMSHTPPRLQTATIEPGKEVDLYCFSCDDWHEAVITGKLEDGRMSVECGCSDASTASLPHDAPLLCSPGCYTGSNPTHTRGTWGSNLENLATEACAGGELLVAASKRWAMTGVVVEPDDGAATNISAGAGDDAANASDNGKASDVADTVDADGEVEELVHPSAATTARLIIETTEQAVTALQEARAALQEAARPTPAPDAQAEGEGEAKGQEAADSSSAIDMDTEPPVVKGGLYAKEPLMAVVTQMRNISSLKTAQAFLQDVEGAYQQVVAQVVKVKAVAANRRSTAAATAEAQMKLCGLKLELLRRSKEALEAAAAMRLDSASMRKECERLQEQQRLLAPGVQAHRQLLEDVAREERVVQDTIIAGGEWYANEIQQFEMVKQAQMNTLGAQREEEARLLEAAQEAVRRLYQHVQERAHTEANIEMLEGRLAALRRGMADFATQMASKKSELWEARNEAQTLDNVTTSVAKVLETGQAAVEALLARMPVDEQSSIEHAIWQTYVDTKGAKIDIAKQEARLKLQRDTLQQEKARCRAAHAVAREFGAYGGKTAATIEAELAKAEAEIEARDEALVQILTIRGEVEAVEASVREFARTLPTHASYADSVGRAEHVSERLLRRLDATSEEAVRTAAAYMSRMWGGRSQAEAARIAQSQRVIEDADTRHAAYAAIASAPNLLTDGAAALACASGAPGSTGAVYAASMQLVQELVTPVDALGGGRSAQQQ